MILHFHDIAFLYRNYNYNYYTLIIIFLLLEKKKKKKKNWLLQIPFFCSPLFSQVS